MKQFTFILITLSLFMSQSLHSQEVYNGLVKIKQNIAEVKKRLFVSGDGCHSAWIKHQ